MSTVIITGATGFIGKSLAMNFLKEGNTVFGIGRDRRKFEDLELYPNFHGIELDFSQYSAISSVIECNQQIDYFIHAAYRGVNGSKKSDYLVQINNLEVACTTVMQAIKMNVKRYINVGSVDEYEIAKIPDAPFCEPTHSRIYASIKYSAEVIGKTLAYENGLDYVSALLTLTYGEGNHTNILPNMIIRNTLQSKPINLIKGNDYFDMIYVQDAIKGILAIAKRGKSYESYYVGHEELRTFKEIVTNFCSELGFEQELNFGSYPDPSFSIDYKSIDRTKLFRDTGVKCDFDCKTSIENTKKWICQVDNLM